MRSDDLELQLQNFPLDKPVSIEGESVYLKLHQDGAELGASFMETSGSQQIRDALQLGFQSALEFEAGWSLADDGVTLQLSRWLPNARDWLDAAEALEQLLGQIELLRTTGAGSSSTRHQYGGSQEQRLRKLLAGEIS